jgi:hypothetical protein
MVPRRETPSAVYEIVHPEDHYADKSELPPERDDGEVLLAKTRRGETWHVAEHSHRRAKSHRRFAGRTPMLSEYDCLQGACGEWLIRYNVGSRPDAHVPPENRYTYADPSVIEPDNELLNVCSRCAQRFVGGG